MVEFLCRLGVHENSATSCRLKSLLCRLVRFCSRHIPQWTLLNLAVCVDLRLKLYSFGLNKKNAVFPVSLDKIDTAMFLIECGADSSIIDGFGNSPLHTLQCFIDTINFEERSYGHYENENYDHLFVFCEEIYSTLKDYTLKFVNHGAHVDSRNSQGKIAYEIMNVLSIEFDAFSHERLQCLAARVLSKSQYPLNLIPRKSCQMCVKPLTF